MKNLTKGLTTSLCVFSLVSVPCFGQEEKDKGFYATAGAGTVYTDSFHYGTQGYAVDSGFSFETGLGYRFNPNLRLEITYNGNNGTVVNSNLAKDLVSHSFFFNGYYDIANNSKWTPYIGGGIGTVTVDTDATTDDDDSAETLQLKLGLTYDASEKVDIFGEVGYQSIGNINVGNTDVDDSSMVRAQLGLRYFF
tara:strand:- start:62 stop:643 length:582 start_codon:yes stop_codon:yes gene_type:complete